MQNITYSISVARLVCCSHERSLGINPLLTYRMNIDDDDDDDVKNDDIYIH